jgi:hypothetical protein
MLPQVPNPLFVVYASLFSHACVDGINMVNFQLEPRVEADKSVPSADIPLNGSRCLCHSIVFAVVSRVFLCTLSPPSLLCSLSLNTLSLAVLLLLLIVFLSQSLYGTSPARRFTL